MHKKSDFSFYGTFIKKYWAILVPVLIVIIGFIFRVVQKQASLPVLFGYVSSDAQQVVVNRPARNLGNTQDLSMGQVPQGVTAQFQQIELMLMTQVGQSTGDQLIFLDTYDGFVPQDFLDTLNSEVEVTYTYKRLNDGIYLFGPKQLVSTYVQPSQKDLFFADTKIADFSKIFKNYGMTIISRNQKSLGLPTQFAQLFANVEYIIMAVDSKKSDISFVSRVIYNKSTIFSGSDFDPKFTEYLKVSTMGYLELGAIAGLLPDPQLNTSLTGNDLVQQAVVAEITKQLFRDHTALIISQGSNPTNLAITIASADPSLFTKLKPWIPSLGQWLRNQEWLTGAVLSPVETITTVGYMITLDGNLQIGLLLEKDGDQTVLRIGNPLLDGSSSKKLLYKDDSLATLHIDVDQMFGLYKQILNMGFSPDLSTQDAVAEQFKGKTLRATVFGDEFGLGLEGEIK